MSELSTYLHEDDVEAIVRICGQEIRAFLDHLVAAQKDSPYYSIKNYEVNLKAAKKEFRQSMDDFCLHPQRYSDDALVKNGADIEEAFHFPVRIEVRRTLNVSGASQVAAKGIYGDFRSVVLQELSKLKSSHGHGFDVRSAGRSSFEINVKHVNKALPLRYLRNHCDDILFRMGYKPGKYIDVAVTKTIIAADGDSTTYGPPTEKRLPVLKESVAYNRLIEYLTFGGVYMIISGNDLQRTIARVTEFIPLELKNRLIISANGGADIAIYHNGHFELLEEYREFALQEIGKKSSPSIDMIFIGDNPSVDGNDYQAFEEMGENHSVLVSLQEPSDRKMQDLIYVGGFEKGTDSVLKKVNAFAKKNKQKPLFNNLRKLLS